MKIYEMSRLVTKIHVAFTSLHKVYLKTLSVAQKIEGRVVGLLVEN